MAHDLDNPPSFTSEFAQIHFLLCFIYSVTEGIKGVSDS